MANARKFSKVSPALWASTRFCGLSSSDAKLLYLYYVTCQHNNSAGAYQIKAGYALTDLVSWTAEQYQSALQSLIVAELVAYDAPLETIYILRWFQHNPPQNEKHAQGTRRIIEQLDSDIIAELAMTDFEVVESRRTPPQPAKPDNVSPGLVQQLTRVGGKRW